MRLLSLYPGAQACWLRLISRVVNCCLLAALLAVPAHAVEVPVLFVAGDGTGGVFNEYDLGYSGELRHNVATGVKAVAAGGSALYLIKADDSLWACGRNDLGQLGDGTLLHRATPVQVASDVAAAAGGSVHVVLLKTDGSVWTAGSNRSLQLGADSTLAFRATAAQMATDAIAVAAGDEHTLFLKSDGTLWGCGSNASGQLGPTASAVQAAPVQIASGVSAIAACGSSTMWVGTDGSLWGLGANGQGQLGDGTQAAKTAPVKVMAAGAAKVALGRMHSLVIKSDGTLWGAGMGFMGQLGGGSTIPFRTTHALIASDVTAAACGSYYTIFRISDGVAYATGWNQYGELGLDGLYIQRDPTPMAVSVLTIAAGDYFSTILAQDGTVFTMGKNDFGQLGIGRSASRAQPLPKPGVSGSASAKSRTGLYRISSGSVVRLPHRTGGAGAGVVDLVATGGTYELVVTQAGELRMIDPSAPFFDSQTARFDPVAGGTDVAAAVSGASHLAFVKRDGSLWTMGSNSFGQLGDGSTTSRATTPFKVAEGVTQVSALNHTLFVKTDGTLWGVGDNQYGQLGAGESRVLTPVQVAADVSWAAAGNGYSLFVKTDGTLWATGNTSPLLGSNPPSPGTPVQVTDGAARVWAGTDHALILKTDASLWAIGQNLYGQLADGSYTARTSPVKIAEKVVWAEAGERKTLIMRQVATPVVAITPANPVAERGGSATLTAEATGEGTFTYQWYAGASGDVSTPIDGATEPSFTTPALLDTATYWVRVSNFAGSTDGATVTVTVSGLAISAQPSGGTVTAGTGSELTVGVLSDPGVTLTYQWYFEGAAIPGATSAKLILPSVQPFHAGQYTVVVTGGGRSVTSGPAVVEVAPAAASAARLTNLSTRALDLTGNNVLIPGFVIRGTGTKRMLIRGVGPGLFSTFELEGTLVDPVLSLGSEGRLVDSNDDWGASANKDAIIATSRTVGAFPLVEGSKDSVLLVDLPPGAYTAPTAGAAGGTGIAMVELYDADPGPSTAHLVNISNRGFVDIGHKIMIPGFVISNEGSRTVLIRAVGPGLASTFHLEGVLEDPVLTVFRRGEPILSNDDWSSNRTHASTESTSRTVGAFALVAGSKDAAFVVTLPPGVYTAQATGKNDTTGIVLVEVYLVP